MAAAIVQMATPVIAADDTQTFAMPGNVVSGNRLVAAFLHSYIGCAPSPSDSQGNTYAAHSSGALHPTSNNAGQGQYLWVASAPIGSSAALTFDPGYSCGNSRLQFIAEVSGLDGTTPYGGVNSDNQAASPAEAGSVTPDVNGSLIIGLFHALAGQPTWTAGSGLTKAFEDEVNGACILTYIQPTAAAKNLDVAVSGNAGDIVGYAIWFRAAAATVLFKPFMAYA